MERNRLGLRAGIRFDDGDVAVSGPKRGRLPAGARDLVLHGFLAVNPASRDRLMFTELGRAALRAELIQRPRWERHQYPRLHRQLGLYLDSSKRPAASLDPVAKEFVRAFLHRLAVVGHTPPCVVSRHDLMRLLSLANLTDTQLFKVVTVSVDHAMAIDAKKLLAAVKAARRRLKAGATPTVPGQSDGLRRSTLRVVGSTITSNEARISMAKATNTPVPPRPATTKTGAKTSAKAAKTSAPKRQPDARGSATSGKLASPKAASAKAASAKSGSPAAPAPALPSAKPTTVTLRQLSAELGDMHGLDPKAAHGVVVTLFQSIASRLKSGDKVRLDGFGVIEVKDRPARAGRNPATGETIQIAASRKLVFRPAKELKATV